MTSPNADDGGYDLKPQEPTQPRKPRPGEPGWVEPVPVVEKIEVHAEPVVEGVDDDAEKNRAVAILGYFFFVIPLVAAPKSTFARFHGNQALLVFLCWIGAFFAVIALHFGDVVAAYIFQSIGILKYFVGCVFYLLQAALLFGALVLTIMGIINAANGERKPLPLIGHWNLLK